MRLAYHVMSAPAPLGLLFLAASPAGLRYLEFMDRRSLKRTIASHERDEAGTIWEPSLRDLRPLADQLDEYLSGARRDIDWRLDPQSDDELSLAVWQALRKVSYGDTCTVATLAQVVGQPRNLRAVAQAVLTNPLAILVPCHRVLGADGKPSNYVRRVAAQEVPAVDRAALQPHGRARRQPRHRRLGAARAACGRARDAGAGRGREAGSEEACRGGGTRHVPPVRSRRRRSDRADAHLLRLRQLHEQELRPP